MDYTIRQVTDNDDKLAISRIYEESWKYAYRGIVPQSYLDSIPEGRWVKNLNNDRLHSLVILEKDKYIGAAGFCKSRFPEFEDYGEIVSIYLVPENIASQKTAERCGFELVRKDMIYWFE